MNDDDFVLAPGLGEVMHLLPPAPTSPFKDCQHLTLDVDYRVPVTVRVKDGQVLRVVVEDDCAELAPSRPAEVECADCGSYVTRSQAVAAQQAAQDADWPEWEVGW